MKAKEIRKLDIEKIPDEILKLEKKVFDLRSEVENRQVDDLSRLKKTRRDIARHYTILAEKNKKEAKSS
jgi:large subunit ribosomal protein L29